MAGHPIFASLYDAILASSERSGLADRRATLLSGASGRTLELGAGTGINAPHYPETVTELVLTEPDPHMVKRLRAKLEADPPRSAYEVVESPAERLRFDDESFDTVVVTLVMCSVKDPARVAAEVARVLKPQGRLLLYEHVRDPSSRRVARWQDRLERPWGWFTGHCHPNRDTAATLGEAGFDLSGIEPDEFPKAPVLARPVIWGSATRTSG